MNKERLKTVVVSAGVSALTAWLVVSAMAQPTTERQQTQIVVPPSTTSTSSNSLSTETEKTYTKGGSFNLSTSDGKTLELKVPDSMYETSDDYIKLISEGVAGFDIGVSNIVVMTGDTNVSMSTDVVTCVPHSTVREMYTKIYGEQTLVDNPALIYSPTYHYLKEGKFPDDLKNGEVKELETLTKDGMEFKVYSTTYDTPYTVTLDSNGNPLPENEYKTEYITTSYINAIYEGEDPIEIEIYKPQSSDDDKLSLLKDILQIN